MTRPLRIVYEERAAAELVARGELRAELEALAQDLLVSIGATGVAIAQRQPHDSQALVCVVSVGRSVPAPGAQVDPQRGISGRCVREGRTQKSYDTMIDPRVDDSVCQQLGIRSLAAVPLMSSSRCMGLLEAFSDRAGHFDEERVRDIEHTASRIVELLGYDAEGPVPSDSSLEPLPGAADLNLMKKREEGTPDFEEPEPFSIHERHLASWDINQEELSAKSRWSAYWVIAVLIFLAIILALTSLMVRPRHAQVPSPGRAKQRPPGSAATPSSLPSASTSADVAAITARASNDAPASPQTPKHSLVERAQRGDVKAQLDLASAYQKGNTVPRDPVRAITWYIVAGANGNAQAKQRSIELTRSVTPIQIGQIRYNVGRMYVEGIGLKRDYVSAYAWFELARAQGEIRAKAEENKLESRMTAGQIVKAKARAAAWLNLHRQKALRTRER